MTTLPQTTASRLPQGSGPMPPNSLASQVQAGPAALAGQWTSADVWRVIRGNLWWMILLTLIGGGAAAGLHEYYRRTAPRYTAVGILQILPPPSIDLIRSTGDVDFAPNSMAVEQRTHANLLTSEPVLSSLIQSPVVRETAWFGEFAGDKANPNVARLKKELRERLNVQPIPDSALIRVFFSCSAPLECKKVVDELVRIYFDQQRDSARGRLDSKTKALRDRGSTLAAQIARINDRVNSQKILLTQKGLSAPGTFGPKERELGLLVEAQLKASTEASEAKNMSDRVSAIVARGDPLPEVEKAIENDQSVASFVRDVSSLKISRDLQKDTYGPDHTSVKKYERLIELTQAQLDARRQELRVKYTNQLVESLKGQSAQTQANLDAINKRIDALKNELAELGKEVQRSLIDQEEEKGLREVRTDVENRLRNIESSASPENQMRITWASGGQPEAPEAPTFPKLVLFLPVGLFLGLALGTGLAFLREFLDQTVRSPRDISRVGHMNVLGIIADESDDPQVADAQLAIYDAPHSLTAEQFRQVRTRLQHVAPFDSTRSMLISGPSPLDGKTTVAANLAAGLALNGRKVLLVDSNFRRPEIHRIFGAENVRGFSDVLNGAAAITDVAVTTRIPNLSILPSGAKPMNATELFESQLLSDFIDHASEEYDHVIFDSGPLLVVAEAAALAAKVDGVITVVRAHADSRGKLQRMCEEMRKVRAEHLGVVLNAVQARGGGYYRKTIKTFYDYQNAA